MHRKERLNTFITLLPIESYTHPGTERHMAEAGITRRVRRLNAAESLGTYRIQKLENGAVHRWYRFVLAYPDLYVRGQAEDFGLGREDLVLDPFVGSGTTCVECKFVGLPSIGIDAHPFFVFATHVKTTWDVDVEELRAERVSLLKDMEETFVARSILDLGPKGIASVVAGARYPGLVTPKYVSPLPLARCLALKERIEKVADRKIRDLFRLALGTTFVVAANVDFGPEIGLTEPKRDAPVLETFRKRTAEMVEDLQKVDSTNTPETRVWQGDSRDLDGIEPRSISAIITSPPYPVDKDYTRQIRLESALLGFVSSLVESRAVKEKMVRASTRQIYASDREKELVIEVPEVVDVMDEVVRRTRRDGDTSGFAKQYPRLIGEYFGGMKRHLESAYSCLRRGGRAAYVVGDSQSFKRVRIETARILGIMAKRIGYEVTGIQRWRDRRSTAHDDPLPENILLLRKR